MRRSRVERPVQTTSSLSLFAQSRTNPRERALSRVAGLAMGLGIGLGALGCGTAEMGEGAGSDDEGGGGASATASQTSASTSSATGTGGGAQIGELGAAYCPSEGPEVGVDVGQRLPSLEVRDCSGNVVSLDDFCGAEGLWIFAAHAWCPSCRSVSENQEAIVDSYAAQGLVGLNIVVEDGSSESTTDAYCELWRETHGHQNVYTLHDPTAELLSLWPGGSTSLSMFVDRDRVIVSKLQYVSNQSTIEAAIDELFSR
jgi:hypothetical protein